MSGYHWDARTNGSGPAVHEVAARVAIGMLRRGEDLLCVDVREQHEWNLFRIPGAVHIPLGALRDAAPVRIPVARRVMVYCARGGRAATAAQTLAELGYANVISLEGGLAEWVSAGGMLEE